MEGFDLPMSFGKSKSKGPKVDLFASSKRSDAIDVLEASTSKAKVLEREIEDAEKGVELEPSRRLPVEEDEDEGDGESDGDDGDYWVSQEEGSDLPVTHEVVMKDHTKTVSALSLDPSGTRVASGSYDYDVKLWDFGGMNASFKPFRSFECNEGHQVNDVQFSNSGDSILVATGALQAKLFDRDGALISEYVKGDMYIRDLRHTDGHVSSITCLCWHPKNPSLFLTGSADSTLRIWEVGNKRKSKSCIVVKSKERGGRSKVTAVSWSQDGKWIGAACEDGAIHIWASNSNFARPNATAENAHEKGTTTSSIVFSSDSKHLVSRGGDGTVKLWDTKSFKRPLFTATSLPSLNAETNVIFSPDEKYILTGTAGSHAGVLAGQAEEEKAKELEGETREGGKVVVLRKSDLGVVRKLDISKFSVVKVLWHPKINQILTGSSDGSIHVLYSPLTSLKGVTLAVSRGAPRVRPQDGFSTVSDGVGQQIIAPHSLPMFKEEIGAGREGGGKRKRERDRHDEKKTMKPMPPITGPGRGGRVGSAATQHVVQGLIRDDLRTQDPREALLKYAVTNVEDNEWTSAWTKTQPKPVFDDRPDPLEEERERKEAEKKRRLG